MDGRNRWRYLCWEATTIQNVAMLFVGFAGAINRSGVERRANNV